MKPLPYPTIEPKPATYTLVERDPVTKVPLLELKPENLRMLLLTAVTKK